MARTLIWAQGMASSLKASYDCVKVFSETDFTEDLRRFDVPTLVIHGDDDPIVPLAAAGQASARLVKGAPLEVYKGAPTGSPRPTRRA